MARVLRPLLLLLLLATLDSGLAQGNNCNKGNHTVNEEDITDEDGEKIYNGFLEVKKNVNGISFEVQGTDHVVWFPRPCFPNDECTQIMAKMKMEHNTIAVTLITSKCKKECKIDSTHFSTFTIVADSSLSWFKIKPQDCNCNSTTSFPSGTTTSDYCDKPPIETIPSPSYKTTSNTKKDEKSIEGKQGLPLRLPLPWWAIVLVLVAVLVVGAVMVSVWRKCGTSRNATNPPNELNGLENSPRVIENEDLYETLDGSFIESRSCEAIHWSSKDDLSPVQEEPYTTENELYESFSSYGHR